MAENKSGSRIFLLSSLALGVLAMAAAFVYLENAAGQDKGPKTMIVVAKRDIRETAALDPEKDLETLEIPARMSALGSLSLPPTMRDSYKGQRVNRNILAGTPVMLADLAAAATLELRGDGRALSIPVKGANALSGLVIPGDYVKLLVTRPVIASRPPPSTNPTEFAPVEGPSTMRYETALVAPTAFRVIAVNQRLSRSRPQVSAGEAYQSAGEGGNQAVTLEVTEAQAKSILEQTGAGQLPVTLLMCPPGTPGVPPAAGGSAPLAPTTSASR